MKTSDREKLVELAWYKMPYGAHKGKFLSTLPESYYIWFKRQGFPKGKLGDYMQIVFDMKVNGIESILYDIRQNTINDR